MMRRVRFVILRSSWREEKRFCCARRLLERVLTVRLIVTAIASDHLNIAAGHRRRGGNGIHEEIFSRRKRGGSFRKEPSLEIYAQALSQGTFHAGTRLFYRFDPPSRPGRSWAVR